MQCHASQLEHVRNGCLTCLYQHIRSYGSRIESLNRQWNAVIKHVSSGLANYLALSYNFVLRKNIRTAMRNPCDQRSDFIDSTFGSHYVGLVDYVARLWNRLYEESKAKGIAHHVDEAFEPLPVLKDVASREIFGLALTQGMTSFCGKLDIQEIIKIEEEDDEHEPQVLEEDADLDECTSPHEAVSETALLKGMDIDPALLLIPLESRPDIPPNPSTHSGPTTSATPNCEGGDNASKQPEVPATLEAQRKPTEQTVPEKTVIVSYPGLEVNTETHQYSPFYLARILLAMIRPEGLILVIKLIVGGLVVNQRDGGAKKVLTRMIFGIQIRIRRVLAQRTLGMLRVPPGHSSA